MFNDSILDIDDSNVNLIIIDLINYHLIMKLYLRQMNSYDKVSLFC